MQQSTETDWDRHYRRGTLRKDFEVEMKTTDREIMIVLLMFFVSFCLAVGAIWWMLS